MTSDRSLVQCILKNDNLSLAIQERSLTIDKCIFAPNVTDLIVTHGEQDLLMAIAQLLVSTATYFNTGGNLNNAQAIQIASLFISEYKQESIEDLVLCLKKLKLGAYGVIYRIDGDTVFKSFNLYLDEKNARLEELRYNERQQQKQEVDSAYIEIAADILRQKEERMKEENERLKADQAKPKMPLFLTDKGHFESIKIMVPDFTDNDLEELLKYYKSINVPVQSKIEYGQPITIGHFDHYVKMIEEEITNRTKPTK